VYIASIGPKNVELTAELADGWLPIFYSPTRARAVWGDSLSRGLAAADPGRAADFDVAPTVTVVVGDDVAALRDKAKPMVALYVGGMGAKGKNFYNDLACRYGFEEAARTVQDLYLAGKKAEATAAIPNELADEVALVGPPARIRDRLGAWRESGITTLIAGSRQVEALRTLAEALAR